MWGSVRLSTEKHLAAEYIAAEYIYFRVIFNSCICMIKIAIY